MRRPLRVTDFSIRNGDRKLVDSFYVLNTVAGVILTSLILWFLYFPGWVVWVAIVSISMGILIINLAKLLIFGE